MIPFGHVMEPVLMCAKKCIWILFDLNHYRILEATKHLLMRFLYEDFEDWFRDNHANNKLPTMKEILIGIRRTCEVKPRVRVSNKISSGIELINLKQKDDCERSTEIDD